MNIPAKLKYTKKHEWVRVEGDSAVIGITDYAQGALGDIVFVELPQTGKEVKQFGELAMIESIKSASDIFAPVAGTVCGTNEALDNAPELINAEPYGQGWICRLEGIDPTELDGLMGAQEYAKFVEEIENG